MKRLILTRNYDDTSIAGELILNDLALMDLATAPNQVITFAFMEAEGSNKFEVIGASLIPTQNVPKDKIEDMFRERTGE